MQVVFFKVADETELKPKQVKVVIDTYMELVSAELKKNGKFKLGGAPNIQLKKKLSKAARTGLNPFTEEPCVSAAQPARKLVKVLPMQKFKELVK